MRHLGYLVLAAVCLGLGACGGGDGGAPGVSVKASNICSEVAEVACYNLYRCCDEGLIEEVLAVDEPRSEADCRQDMERRCERSIATREWSYGNQRATFDGDAMTTCLEALIAPDDDCSLVDTKAPWVEACKASAWKGAVADGNECYYPWECASESSYCAPNRTCTSLPVENQPCASGQCAAGLFCDFGTCEKLLTMGEACTGTAQCNSGLYCDRNVGGDGTCQPLIATDMACESDESCESKDCLPGVCAGSTQSCFTDGQCTGTCEGSTRLCTTDAGCGGTCSVSGFTCTGPLDCNTGETCNLVRCLGAECVGDPVCVENLEQFDYCTDALAPLPIGSGPGPL
jgi:hypothetical protein